MSGGTHIPPIKYSDDAVIVNPKDWNDLVDLFLAAQDSINTAFAVRTITEADTVLSTDRTLVVVYSGSSYTISLPPAADVLGHIFIFTRSGTGGSGNITIDADGSETIDGSASKIITNAYDSFTIVSTGSEWIVISEKP